MSAAGSAHSGSSSGRWIASVILDVTVIQLLIVRSLMFLFDAANWWMPGWLERVLPRLEPAVESSPPIGLRDRDAQRESAR